jgi:hypothetical protein
VFSIEYTLNGSVEFATGVTVLPHVTSDGVAAQITFEVTAASDGASMNITDVDVEEGGS